MITANCLLPGSHAIGRYLDVVVLAVEIKELVLY
jgi:hypothetical protein